MNKFEAFKKAYQDVPSQDNEGYVPDRGSFKQGFIIAWDMKEEECNLLKERIKKLRSAIIKQNNICDHDFVFGLGQLCSCSSVMKLYLERALLFDYGFENE